MARVLIVSDYSRTSYSIESEFSRFGWLSENMSMQLVLNQGNSVTKGFDNIVFIIDTNFRKNFISVIKEMESLISNCSNGAAVYLLFEDDYDPIFAPWLAHIKRMFKSIHHKINLEEAVKEMINLSFEPVHLNTFVSPMNGF